LVEIPTLPIPNFRLQTFVTPDHDMNHRPTTFFDWGWGGKGHVFEQAFRRPTVPV